uniref:Uncharacterized protein n=1 Tax=Solanum lycopersicum TaxID=4081 RepID=A0A3Q7ESA7_SOLLC
MHLSQLNCSFMQKVPSLYRSSDSQLDIADALPIESFSFCSTCDCCELFLYATEITILEHQKLYNQFSYLIFSLLSSDIML